MPQALRAPGLCTCCARCLGALLPPGVTSSVSPVTTYCTNTTCPPQRPWNPLLTSTDSYGQFHSPKAGSHLPGPPYPQHLEQQVLMKPSLDGRKNESPPILGGAARGLMPQITSPHVLGAQPRAEALPWATSSLHTGTQDQLPHRHLLVSRGLQGLPPGDDVGGKCRGF